MCVIIVRQPDVEIPFEKLELACDINKHGFGVMYAEKGKLTMKWNSTKNDPKEVEKLLKDLKKHEVFLHLRHATVGDTSEANQHPFVSLLDMKHQPLIGLMHNGTIYSYTPPYHDKTTSDTALFNSKLCRPLFFRTAKTLGLEKVLTDDFVKWLIEKETGTMSKMVFLDSHGQSLYVNKSAGTQFGGWWASNDYSFSNTHTRRTGGTGSAVIPFTATKNTGTNINDPLPWERISSPVSVSGTAISTWESDLARQDNLKRKAQLALFGRFITKLPPTQKESLYVMTASDKPRYQIRNERHRKPEFLTEANLNSYDDLGNVTEVDLSDCVTNWPDATVSLIVGLLAERLQMKKDLQVQVDAVVGLKVRVENQAKTIKDFHRE